MLCGRDGSAVSCAFITSQFFYVSRVGLWIEWGWLTIIKKTGTKHMPIMAWERWVMSEQRFEAAHATRYHIGNPPLAMKTTLRALSKLGVVPVFADNSAFKTWIKSNGGRGLGGDRAKADDATRAYLNLGVALELEDGRIVVDLPRFEQLVQHTNGDGSWNHLTHKSAAKRARRLLKDLEDAAAAEAATDSDMGGVPDGVATARPVAKVSTPDPVQLLKNLRSRQAEIVEHGSALAAARVELARMEQRLQEASDSEREAEEQFNLVRVEVLQSEGECLGFDLRLGRAQEDVAALEQQLTEARSVFDDMSATSQRAWDHQQTLLASCNAASDLLEEAKRKGEETLVAREAAFSELNRLLAAAPKDHEKLAKADDLLRQLAELLNN